MLCTCILLGIESLVKLLKVLASERLAMNKTGEQTDFETEIQDLMMHLERFKRYL